MKNHAKLIHSALQSDVSRPLTLVIELLSNNIAFAKLMQRVGIGPCDWLNFSPIIYLTFVKEFKREPCRSYTLDLPMMLR